MVRTAAKLFRHQGYEATGWRQVIADSATPWGSQAHHFPGGKVQLGVEAIERAGAGYERLLRSALADRHPAEAVSAWASVAASEMAGSGWVDGCPVATVALEKAHDSAPLAAACANAFASWHTALAEAITARGVATEDADALATLVLAAIEGGLLLARAHRDSTPLTTVGHELASILRTRVP
jgi:AcrR family transcriptional regulator